MAIEFEERLDPDLPRKNLLLPRVSKFGECPGIAKASDRIDVIPRNQWDEIIAARKKENVSLREVVPFVLDQDGRGSCAQEQGCGANMLVRAYAGEAHVKLNPWPNYYRITGGRDRGSSIDSAYRYGREWGWIPMSLCPRSGSFKRQPQKLWDEAQKYRFDEVIDVKGQDEFVTCLLKGFSVGYGRRGHAILAVEYLGNYKFKYLNSWGSWTDCNDRGFGIDDIRRDLGGYGMFAARTNLSLAS